MFPPRGIEPRDFQIVAHAHVRKELVSRLEALPFPFSSKKYLQSTCRALFVDGMALLVTQALQISRNLYSSLVALIFPWWTRRITRSKCLVVGPLAHAYNIRKTPRILSQHPLPQNTKAVQGAPQTKAGTWLPDSHWLLGNPPDRCQDYAGLY